MIRDVGQSIKAAVDDDERRTGQRNTGKTEAETEPENPLQTSSQEEKNQGWMMLPFACGWIM